MQGSHCNAAHEWMYPAEHVYCVGGADGHSADEWMYPAEHVCCVGGADSHYWLCKAHLYIAKTGGEEVLRDVPLRLEWALAGVQRRLEWTSNNRRDKKAWTRAKIRTTLFRSSWGDWLRVADRRH